MENIASNVRSIKNDLIDLKSVKNILINLFLDLKSFRSIFIRRLSKFIIKQGDAKIRTTNEFFRVLSV